jgi:hypothetical protein
VAKIKFNFTEEEYDDLLSAISFTLSDYPQKGAKEFLAALKKLYKKMWRKK